jgi:carbon-monoxide dehydrogenase large subunit
VAQGIGARVLRKEDEKHLRGRACFVGDVAMPGLMEVAFVRSPVAHARITGIHFPEQYRGRIFTAADLGAGVAPVRTPNSTPGYRASDYPALATGKVRMVGEALAMCVAATRAEAEDLCQQVVLDLEELPPLVDAREARKPGAALVHDEVPGNLFMSTDTDHGFDALAAQAEVTVTREFHFARQCSAPLEGTGVLAWWDRAVDQLVVMSSTQVPHMIRTAISDSLGLPQAQVRVVAPDVGGGFGYKSVLQPEELAVAWLARTLRRPVRWVQDRREHLTAAANTREHHYVMTAHCDRRGRLLALDVDLTIDVGAYSAWPISGGLEASLARFNIPGPYAFRGFRCRTHSVATNKPPMTPYRGVARPGAGAALDLTLDAVARAVGRDPAQVKLENLVPAEAMPYNTVTGSHYDSGDYPRCMRMAMDEIGLAAVRERQARDEPDGRWIGVGILTYVETTAPGTMQFARIGVPNVPGYEQASLRLTPDGGLEIRVGVQSHGQGMETTLAQVAHEVLGIPLAQVKVIHGDTAVTPFSTGIYASRGMIMAGGAVSSAAEVLAGRIKRIAAHLLKCAPAEVQLAQAQLRGPAGAVSLRDVAGAWYLAPDKLAADVDPCGLEATVGYKHQAPGGAISYGTHAAVVAVDPETGTVEILDYVVVEDCGTIVNPLIVEGQTYGGIAQGIGTALYEEMPYDDAGQPLASTLADYVLPGAPEVPHIRVLHLETPSPYTRHGIKGVGEGGTIGATGAIACAVNDALRRVGAEVNATPMTARRILQAILKTRSATPATPATPAHA